MDMRLIYLLDLTIIILITLAVGLVFSMVGDAVTRREVLERGNRATKGRGK